VAASSVTAGSARWIEIVNDLARILTGAAQFRAALDASSDAMQSMEALTAVDPLLELDTRLVRGAILRALGRYREAEPMLLSAVALAAGTLGEGHAATGAALNELGMLHRYAGRPDAAARPGRKSRGAKAS
jgi:hypothetical protein